MGKYHKLHVSCASAKFIAWIVLLDWGGSENTRHTGRPPTRNCMVHAGIFYYLNSTHALRALKFCFPFFFWTWMISSDQVIKLRHYDLATYHIVAAVRPIYSYKLGPRPYFRPFIQNTISLILLSYIFTTVFNHSN